MIWSSHTKSSSGDAARKFAAEFFDVPTQVESLDTELESNVGYRGFFRVSGCSRLYKLLGSRLGWSVRLA